MEKQKLVEWENPRKIELEQHRSVLTLGHFLSDNNGDFILRQRETENVINLRAKKETIGAELEGMVRTFLVSSRVASLLCISRKLKLMI